VPASVPGLDAEEFRVGDRTDDAERALRALRAERRAYLAEFPDLRASIREAVY
jgi:phosphoenolpyruvate carboxykinase (ATP)